MKKFYKTIIFVLIIAIALSTVAAAAEARASDYITLTNASISASSGKVTVTFVIQATGMMTKVGVTSIKIYKSNGTLVKTYSYTNSAYSYFMASDDYYHSGSVTYTGTSGTSYYAEVNFYAADSSGSDTVQSYTSTVTA